MADSAQGIVFVAGAGVDVDANAREVAGQGLCGDADAIGQGGDAVEVGGVLYWRFRIVFSACSWAGAGC